MMSVVPEYDLIAPSLQQHRVRRATTEEGVFPRDLSVRLNTFGRERVLHLRPNSDFDARIPFFFADLDHSGTGVQLTPMAKVNFDFINNFF